VKGNWVLVGKYEGNRSVGRRKCRCDETIKIYISEEQDARKCTGLIWLRIRKIGGMS
jgi:hypothetical protein